MDNLSRRRVCRVEQPRSVPEWLARGGADLITDEFNRLMTYLQEREAAIMEQGNAQAGYAIAIVTAALGEVTKTSWNQRDAAGMEPLVSGLVELSRPRRVVELKA